MRYVNCPGFTGSPCEPSSRASAKRPASPFTRLERTATSRPSGTTAVWKKFRSCGPNRWNVPLPSGRVENNGKRLVVPWWSQRVYAIMPVGNKKGSKSSLMLNEIWCRLLPSALQTCNTSDALRLYSSRYPGRLLVKAMVPSGK